MKQQGSSTKRHALDPAELEPWLREIMPVGGGEQPTQVVGWTRANIWTRMRADYPNGFRLEVHFDRTGHVSSTRISGDLTIRPGKPVTEPGAQSGGYTTVADSDGDDGA